MLGVLLRSLGCDVDDIGIQPDSRSRMAETFATIAASHDAVVTSGGVSTGDEDHVKAAIEMAGGQLHFWRLAIKPGRPVALGQIGHVPLFGLPGNPVAAMLTFSFCRAVAAAAGRLCTAVTAGLSGSRRFFIPEKSRPTGMGSGDAA